MPLTLPKTASWIAIAALCAAGSSTIAKKPALSPLQQCIADEAKKSGFSGVVSVIRPQGNVSFTQGSMGGKGSAPMRANAQFNIGSAGKMWTAVSIAQLVDARKVALDDPIGSHVDGLTKEAAMVTIRQLLTHSGGMGNFFVPENLEAMQRAKTLSELKPLIVTEKPIFAPGTRSQYSNSGFLLLGLIIERASGQSYADYLQKNIFTPAGMTASGVMPLGPKLRAIGMTNIPQDGGKDPVGSGGPPPGARLGPPSGGPMMLPPAGPLRVSPEAEMMGTSAGGSFSTPSDMHRFFAALLAGKLTSSAMRDALLSKQFEILPAKGPLPAINYGLGFMVTDHKGHGFIGHNGGLPGGNVASGAFPKDQVTAIVMSNRDPPAADMMMRKLHEMLFDETGCGR